MFSTTIFDYGISICIAQKMGSHYTRGIRKIIIFLLGSTIKKSAFYMRIYSMYVCARVCVFVCWVCETHFNWTLTSHFSNFDGRIHLLWTVVTSHFLFLNILFSSVSYRHYFPIFKWLHQFRNKNFIILFDNF